MPREIVTSENREEYMEKKLAEKSAKKPMSDAEMEMKAVVKKKSDEQFDRIKNHPKYAMLKIKLGKKGAMDALLKELNDKQ
jgi:cytochrome c553